MSVFERFGAGNGSGCMMSGTRVLFQAGVDDHFSFYSIGAFFIPHW